MSFTSDVPIGFDPCGYAFGAVRKPYSADCKFFSDSTWGENRINWYIVPDDTPDYPGPTTFWPRVDCPNNEAQSLNEREGPGRFVRKFDWGLVFVPPEPHVPHGDDQDFMGDSPKSKYYIDGETPDAPCAIIRVHFLGILLTAKLLTADEPLTLGIQVAAELVDPFDPPPPASYAVAGVCIAADLIDPYIVPPYLDAPTLGVCIAAELVDLDGLAGLDAGVCIEADLIDFYDPPTPAGFLSGGVCIAAELVDIYDLPTPGFYLGAGVCVDAELVELEDLDLLDAGVCIAADLEGVDESETAGVCVDAELEQESESESAGFAVMFDLVEV